MREEGRGEGEDKGGVEGRVRPQHSLTFIFANAHLTAVLLRAEHRVIILIILDFSSRRGGGGAAAYFCTL